MAKRKIALVTPGEVLRNDFPAPMGISAYRLAADTGMTQTRSIASTWHGSADLRNADTRLTQFDPKQPVSIPKNGRSRVD